MEKLPTDPLNVEGSDHHGKRTSKWVQFNDENGGEQPEESKIEKGVFEPQQSPSSSNIIPSTSDIENPKVSAHSSDQNMNPAVIETSVAIVPSVQIQSPSKITLASKANTSVTDHSNNYNNRSTTSQQNPSQNNTNKAKPSSTFVNISNLDNIELRNSQSQLNSTSSGSGSNGQNAGVVRRSGFTNGDEIVSIIPMNTRFSWITPAHFKPELVPEELMSESLTLTVEEYVNIMENLTTDFRFNLYIICYKRLLASWLAMAFFILLIILFSGIGGIGLFALGITWLIINAMAVFLCMYIKIKINKGLERCMARVNKLLLKHKLLVGVDDRGRLSCHKIQLCFMYFDSTECIKRLGQVLETSNDRSRLQRHLDVTDVDIVITGTNSRRIPQSQNGERLFLRYVQRYLKDYLRRRLDWTPEGAENPSSPRHLSSSLCPCQYTEEYLRHKPVTENENSCKWWIPCYPRTQHS